MTPRGCRTVAALDTLAANIAAHDALPALAENVVRVVEVSLENLVGSRALAGKPVIG